MYSKTSHRKSCKHFVTNSLLKCVFPTLFSEKTLRKMNVTDTGLTLGLLKSWPCFPEQQHSSSLEYLLFLNFPALGKPSFMSQSCISFGYHRPVSCYMFNSFLSPCFPLLYRSHRIHRIPSFTACHFDWTVCNYCVHPLQVHTLWDMWSSFTCSPSHRWTRWCTS